MTFGLGPTGFSPATFSDIRAALNTALREAFGTSLDLGDLSILGIIVAILSEQYALLWAQAEQVYSSQDPDKATGPALDALCLLTGTFRPAATSTEVDLILAGTTLTSIPSGSQVSDVVTLTRFATATTVALATATTWAAATFAAGQVVTNSSKVFVCITGGTSISGPTTTSLDQTDGGTAHWRYLATGTGYATVQSFATQTGALFAAAGNVTQIQTPIGGWGAVYNVLDASVGRALATDAELRLFREDELAGEGDSTADAIRAALLLLTDVISVTVFHNDTDTTDGNGVPPHSIECLVRGQVEDAAADSAIAEVLLTNVAAGIRTFSLAGSGFHSATAVDDEGVVQTMYFSRPVKVPIYADITVTYDASQYPSDGDTEIQNNIVTWADAFDCGRDAIGDAAGARAYQIPGVLSAYALLWSMADNTDVITTAAAWINTHGYVATTGSRSHVTNDSGRHYICITSGTSDNGTAGHTGPAGTAADITDNTVHWTHVSPQVAISIDPRHLAVFQTTNINIHSSAVTP